MDHKKWRRKMFKTQAEQQRSPPFQETLLSKASSWKLRRLNTFLILGHERKAQALVAARQTNTYWSVSSRDSEDEVREEFGRSDDTSSDKLLFTTTTVASWQALGKMPLLTKIVW